jgi:CheY-like chemotaxis protein
MTLRPAAPMQIEKTKPTMSQETDGKKLSEAVRAASARRGVADAVAGALPAPAVLVVESDPELQWRLARMLTVHGNRVVGTSSGDGALALIRQWAVDLVLVDADLPAAAGMSALELARVLNDERPQIQVVLMTAADARDEVHIAARLAGVVACLTKPFRAETIAEVLRLISPVDVLAGGLAPAE